MLVHISIKNLAIVKKVDLSLSTGFTAITGETGAGKSIAVDALSLCLGHRAESNMVRQGADKAEVVTHFDLKNVPSAIQFLQEHELIQDESPNECFIRRIVSPEGRSKAFINGIPVNLTQLKQLGRYLVMIHGQHDHYQFLKTDNQLNILDQYSQHKVLLQKVATSYSSYKEAKQKLEYLEQQQQQRTDRLQLLSYQVQELDEFSLQNGEFEVLEQQFKKLNNVKELMKQSQYALHLIKYAERSDVLSQLQASINSLSNIAEYDPQVSPIIETLQSAHIQIDEASADLDHLIHNIEDDPQQLQEIEFRYGKSLELARKHFVSPELLYDKHIELINEFNQLKNDASSLSELKEQLQQLLKTYQDFSKELHLSRQSNAKTLSVEIQNSIREMNLPHAEVQVMSNFQVDSDPGLLGNDKVKILISVNPGQAPDLIEKVVSGGELSRIGLALQVITSKGEHLPTMVFDEVDTGISGPTASLIGKLLRRLGAQSQVMCVTHLPQVAAQANNQMFVSKTTDGHSTETNLLKLTKEERVNEIARLLAGDELTDTAIANARDLLKI